MFTFSIVSLLIGVLIGWNFPQPPWAVWVQAKIVALYNKAKDSIKARFAQ